MAKVKITDEYTAEGLRLKKALKELDKLECFIGFQRGEAKEKDGTDITDIAAWNELGTSRGIPSRPFIRNTVDLNEDEINDTLDQMVTEIMNGATAEQVLRETGAYLKGKMQTEITDGSYAPNDPATIKRKRSDKPLIDTGDMRRNVNYQIGKRGRL